MKAQSIVIILSGVLSSSIADFVLKKCHCGINEVLNNSNCESRLTFLSMFDVSNHELFRKNTSDFENSFTIGDVNCTQEQTLGTLSPTSFSLFENGELLLQEISQSVPIERYCIEHVLDNAGELSWTAHVCFDIRIPQCCPSGDLMDENSGDCFESTAMFFPPLSEGGTEFAPKDIPGDVQAIDELSCPPDTVFESNYLQDFKGSLLVLEDLVLLITNNGFDQIHDTDYCVGHTRDEKYIARYCRPQDPEGTIVRKCCEDGWAMHPDDTYGHNCQPFNTNNTFLKFYEPDLLTHVKHSVNSTFAYGSPVCDSIILEQSDYHLLRNGDLLVHNKLVDHRSYCLDDVVFDTGDVQPFAVYCDYIEPESIHQDPQWIKATKMVLMAISCIFLIATFAVYVGVVELRSRTSGKCLISEVVALFGSYLCIVIVSVADVGDACRFFGVTTHTLALASFFWLNVMCYDMWSKVTNWKRSISQNKNSKKRFLMYSIYGWGLPVCMGVASLIVDLLPDTSAYWHIIRPGYEIFCFVMNYTDSTWIYLHGPILLLQLINLGFFIHIAIYLMKTHKESSATLNIDSSSTNRQKIKDRCKLYVKLFLVMGITWIAEIISGQMKYVQTNANYIWIVTDIINALRGVLIFIIFVCKRSTLRKIQKAWQPGIDRMTTATATVSNWLRAATNVKYREDRSRKISDISVSSVKTFSTGVTNLTNAETVAMDKLS